MNKRNQTEVPKSLRSIDVKAVLRRRGVFAQQKFNHQLKDQAKEVARQIIQAKKTGTKVEPQKYLHFSNEQVQSYWEKQIHIVEVLEAKFETKLQQFISKVVNSYVAHLESELATVKDAKKFKAKDYISDNEDELIAQAELDFTPLLTDQAVLAGQEAMQLVKPGEVYTPEALRKLIRDNVTKFTQSMLSTDRDTLTKLVTDGIQSGQSVAQIRGAIQESFDGITRNQAQRITRTEVLRASNQAAVDAWQQSGVVEGKQWVTAGAVDECADYDGAVESLDGSFYQDTTEFLDGDPPLHPNCRCVLIPILLNE